MRAIRAGWLDQATQAGKPESVRLALEQGPWSPNEAKQQGLIDSVGFESEALVDAKKLAKAERVSGGYGGKAQGSRGLDVAELVRVIAGSNDSSTSRPHVAVIPAEGAIAMESGGAFESGGITARAITKTIRRLKKDESIKAVVLRIDSPAALRWPVLDLARAARAQETETARGLGRRMAASGGYYMACAADRIIAEPTSIVGSIGVFGGKIVFSARFEEFGCTPKRFRPAPSRARLPGRPRSPVQSLGRRHARAHRAEMQSVYDLFITRVSDSRRCRARRWKSRAGRIWSGKQELERGLVDQLGGVTDAIRQGAQASRLADDSPVTVEGDQRVARDVLVGEDADEEQVQRALASYQARSLVIRELPISCALRFGAGPLASGESSVVQRCRSRLARVMVRVAMPVGDDGAQASLRSANHQLASVARRRARPDDDQQQHRERQIFSTLAGKCSGLGLAQPD